MSQVKLDESRQGPIVHRVSAGAFWSVVFSPDGKSVVSGSWDQTVRFWDASRPSQIGQPLNGHKGTIYSVAYSPLGDIVASGSKDHTIRLWDPNTHQQIGQPLQGDGGEVNSVAFSPSGNLIASGSHDGNIRLWDTQRRVTTSNPFTEDGGSVLSVAFSPDGTCLVSGSTRGTVCVWDVEHRTTAFKPLKGHKDKVYSVARSPSGSQITSGSKDHTIRLWDTRTGVSSTYQGHTGWVRSVNFSPNGMYVASASDDYTVRVWDIRTGYPIDKPFKKHSGWVYSVAYSPCGRLIASGSYDRTAMIWNAPGSDLDTEGGKHNLIDNQTEPLESDNLELIGRHMSMHDLYELLISHGCGNLVSQMDVNQDTAIVVNGGGFGDIWKGRLYNGKIVAIKAWRASMIEQCDYKTLKCAQVGSGVAYMHDCNATHGDLKALNVLVSSDGVAKLIDFGLSTMAEASLAFSETTNNQTMSTRWAPPELLLEGGSKNKQSVVYALGMTMLVRPIRQPLS
ncbi:hypothetical protein OPQ81_002835 [Rhizoctonia solani]|nr:hypothetical protein OPQ81_002835 [Rhizoctonia solani]